MAFMPLHNQSNAKIRPMADLLLEIFSEEIPARMQAKAEAALKKAVTDGLKAAGLTMDKVAAMSGPRRLAVVIEGLPVRSADVEEERKGPKVGAPEQAVAGFLRGAGLSDISEAEVRSDPKKGDFYIAVKKVEGRDTSDIVADLVPEIVRGFHWPKSMRWGTGDLRWVRPIQRILCILDGKTVPFEIDGIQSGNQTEGHRVHGRGPYKIKSFEDYVSRLGGDGHVRLTRDDRRAVIAEQAEAVCKAKGLELVEDKGLLEEVTGLAEWPVVILGDMDPAFLELPPEVIQLSMRTHQKYFAVRDPKTKKLAPHFVVVANVDAADGGKLIAAGNAKVLSARLEDGRFFYANDKAGSLESMGAKLSTIAFKEELGSIGDKVERVAALARELAPKVGADADLAERAARLAKADLVSEMVYEFPELQGVMGRYYALDRISNPLIPAKAGTSSGREQVPASAGMSGNLLDDLSKDQITQIADAIRDHYKPQGPSDAVPTEPVSIAVALADKLDTLVGFWAIDEKPTGSKDPFALRRAALGVVRLVLENELRLPIRKSAQLANFQVGSAFADVNELAAFFADRLKQYLRDQGERHDLIDAVFALGEDDLVLITKRVKALGDFLETDDGANLLAGYKRAANILKAEAKKAKDGEKWTGGEVDEKLLSAKAEKTLFKAVTVSENAATKALAAEDFTAAMEALAALRAPVDAFFDGPDSVKVNDDDAKVRTNRLALLERVRTAIHTVADFSKVEG